MATTEPANTNEARTTDGHSDPATTTGGTVAPSTDGGRPLPQDVIFGLLSAERRRRLLLHLEEIDGGTTLSEAAERIAAAENGVPVSQLSSDQRKRVYVGLYQSHLPKLDDAGIIEYNQDRGTIELNEAAAEQLLPHLRFEADADDAEVTERPSGLSERIHLRVSRLADRIIE